MLTGVNLGRAASGLLEGSTLGRFSVSPACPGCSLPRRRQLSGLLALTAGRSQRLGRRSVSPGPAATRRRPPQPIPALTTATSDAGQPPTVRSDRRAPPPPAPTAAVPHHHRLSLASQ